MYFVVYLVVGFHSHLPISSFIINTNIHMEGECKTDPSLCKRGGRLIFANECFKQKVVVFLTLLQYTSSGILNLIKIIHAPQSISMRVTSPYCMPPYFCLVYCVPPCFGFAHCVSFNNKTTIFVYFIYIKKIKVTRWTVVTNKKNNTFFPIKSFESAG